ncbi:hypothetical protein D3C76_1725610 [compost metagenome]
MLVLLLLLLLLRDIISFWRRRTFVIRKPLMHVIHLVITHGQHNACTPLDKPTSLAAVQRLLLRSDISLNQIGKEFVFVPARALFDSL